jgi:hypothetical protein
VTASIQVEGARVVAAMTPPTSKAPFNRGRLFLQASDGTTIRVRTYTSDGRVEGPVVSAQDLRELIDTEQITDLSKGAPIHAKAGASLWVLRRNFPSRDRALNELRLSELLLVSPLDGEEDAKLCIVAEGLARATERLDRWRDDAMEAAKSHAKHGDWERARIDAELAQAVCRGLDANVLALLSLAYEKCGREKRASGLLVMARRSRGSDFEAWVVRDREHFERTLVSDIATPAPSATDPYPGLQAALRGLSAAVTEALGMRQDCRLSSVAAAA